MTTTTRHKTIDEFPDEINNKNPKLDVQKRPSQDEGGIKKYQESCLLQQIGPVQNHNEVPQWDHQGPQSKRNEEQETIHLEELREGGRGEGVRCQD